MIRLSWTAHNTPLLHFIPTKRCFNHVTTQHLIPPTNNQAKWVTDLWGRMGTPLDWHFWVRWRNRPCTNRNRSTRCGRLPGTQEMRTVKYRGLCETKCTIRGRCPLCRLNLYLELWRCSTLASFSSLVRALPVESASIHVVSTKTSTKWDKLNTNTHTQYIAQKIKQQRHKTNSPLTFDAFVLRWRGGDTVWQLLCWFGGGGLLDLARRTTGTWPAGKRQTSVVANFERAQYVRRLQESLEIVGISVLAVHHGSAKFGFCNVFILVGVSIVVNAASDGFVGFMVCWRLLVETRGYHTEEAVHLHVRQLVAVVDIHCAENIASLGLLGLGEGHIWNRFVQC